MGKLDFKEPYSHKSDEETAVDIECLPPMDGYRRVVTRVVFENETANHTKTRVGIKRGRLILWFAEEIDPEDGVLYWTTEPLVCLGREQVIVRFAGVHDGDVLNVWEYGYQVEE